MAGSDPKRDPKVVTHATNGNSTQTLLINPAIPVFIGPINPLVTADVVGVQDISSPRQTVLLKASVTDAARSCARIFRTPWKLSGTGRDVATPRYVNFAETNSRLSYPIPSFNSTSKYSARFGNQKVISPIHPSIAKRGRNAEPFSAPINGPLAINNTLRPTSVD